MNLKSEMSRIIETGWRMTLWKRVMFWGLTITLVQCPNPREIHLRITRQYLSTSSCCEIFLRCIWFEGLEEEGRGGFTFIF